MRSARCTQCRQCRSGAATRQTTSSCLFVLMRFLFCVSGYTNFQLHFAAPEWYRLEINPYCTGIRTLPEPVGSPGVCTSISEVTDPRTAYHTGWRKRNYQDFFTSLPSVICTRQLHHHRGMYVHRRWKITQPNTRTHLSDAAQLSHQSSPGRKEKKMLSSHNETVP